MNLILTLAVTLILTQAVTLILTLVVIFFYSIGDLDVDPSCDLILTLAVTLFGPICDLILILVVTLFWLTLLYLLFP